MNRLTLGDARAEIADALGICESNPKVVIYLNRAVRRLMRKGKWVGTFQEYLFCSNDSCIVLPREFETIEGFTLCSRPGTVRPVWYSYYQNGPGRVRSDGCGNGLNAIDEGTCVSFENIIGSDKKIRVYADVAEDADAKILLQFYDENGQYVRTQESGTWINGERVAISTTPQLTTHFVMANGLVGVQKPKTNGPVRLYEYDTVNLTQREIAVYEPDETRPLYRRYKLPGLSRTNGCCNNSVNSEIPQKATVSIIAKLRFIPVANDEDYLQIGNLDALIEMVMALKKSDDDLFEESIAYEARAVQMLQEELSSYLGDAQVQSIQVTNPLTRAAVENFI